MWKVLKYFLVFRWVQFSSFEKLLEKLRDFDVRFGRILRVDQVLEDVVTAFLSVYLVRVDCILDASVKVAVFFDRLAQGCLLYTSPSPRDGLLSRMPSSA